MEILVTEGTFEEDIAKRAATARSEVEEQIYTRAMIEVGHQSQSRLTQQSPRFVCPEDIGEKLFPVRFLPTGEEVVAPAPASPITSTPPETSPTTPLSRLSTRGFMIVSPTIDPEEVVLSRPTSTPTRKRSAEVDAPKKKRARVAFA